MSPAQLRRARQGAAEYLRDAIDGDWVRLINLGTGEAWDGSVPADRARLVAAANGLRKGAAPWAALRASDAIEQTVQIANPGGATESSTSGQFLSVFAETAGLLGTLEALLVQLDGLDGRKALVLMSNGFPQLQDLDRRLQKVASLARQAATTVYFVDAAAMDGLVPEPGRAMASAFETVWRRSGGAQDLAEATGGFVSRFNNSLRPALARIGNEMRTYYVVGYLPTGPEDGRFRSVKVRVARPGAKARTKKGYLAGRPRSSP